MSSVLRYDEANISFDTIRHNTYKIFILFDFLAPKDLNIIPGALRAY